MFSSVHARVCVCVCTRTRNVYERQAVGKPLREILGGHRAVISVRINSFEAQDREGGVPVVLWNIRWRMERKKSPSATPCIIYILYTEIIMLSPTTVRKSERRTRSRLSVADTYTSYIFQLHSLFSLSKSREEETSSRIELSADKPAMKHTKAAPPLPFCTESRLIFLTKSASPLPPLVLTRLVFR